MRSVLVIPTFEEAANIPRLLHSIREYVPDVDILIVDDNSPDGTADLAESIGSELGRIEVIRRPGKAGLGVAYRHGFRHALSRGYDVIGQMDADMSHHPSALPTMFELLDDGYEVVVGSRYIPGGSVPDWGLARRSLSRLANWYAHRVLRLSFYDATTAFRLYRSDVLEGIDIDGTTANGYLFQIETAFRLSDRGFRVGEIPITFLDRDAGASKMAVLETMAQTALRVTWWGLVIRTPGLTRMIRRTAPGRYMEARVRPNNTGTDAG